MTGFPRPPLPECVSASEHCRHYGYEPGKGPKCAKGVAQMEEFGNVRPCLPQNVQSLPTPVGCVQRQEFTDEERAATKVWMEDKFERLIHVLEHLPKRGPGGAMDCPACGTGRLHWRRAPNNGHLAAECTTPGCIQFLQ